MEFIQYTLDPTFGPESKRDPEFLNRLFYVTNLSWYVSYSFGTVVAQYTIARMIWETIASKYSRKRISRAATGKFLSILSLALFFFITVLVGGNDILYSCAYPKHSKRPKKCEAIFPDDLDSFALVGVVSGIFVYLLAFSLNLCLYGCNDLTQTYLKADLYREALPLVQESDKLLNVENFSQGKKEISREKENRLRGFFDNLKVLCTMTVFLGHTGQMYVQWQDNYYLKPVPVNFDCINDWLRFAFCSLILRIMNCYVVSVFFFIGGYFAPLSYERHKRNGYTFLLNKSKDLSIPYVFEIFIWVPCVVYGFPNYLFSGEYELTKHHMVFPDVAWFLPILLSFHGLYALARSILKFQSLKYEYPGVGWLYVYSLFLALIGYLPYLMFHGRGWLFFIPSFWGRIFLYIAFYFAGAISAESKWLHDLLQGSGYTNQKSNRTERRIAYAVFSVWIIMFFVYHMQVKVPKILGINPSRLTPQKMAISELFQFNPDLNFYLENFFYVVIFDSGLGQVIPSFAIIFFFLDYLSWKSAETSRNLIYRNTMIVYLIQRPFMHYGLYGLIKLNNMYIAESTKDINYIMLTSKHRFSRYDFHYMHIYWFVNSLIGTVTIWPMAFLIRFLKDYCTRRICREKPGRPGKQL